MAFAEIAKWDHLIFLQNDGLPGFLLNSFVQLRASDGLLILWSPWKFVLHFFYVIHFADTQFREILVCFLGPKIMAFAEIAKWNHLIFLQNDGLPGFLLNSFVSLPTSNGLLILWSPWKSVWHFFYIIHFVDTQFRENLSVFPWHQNYGFCRDREMKSFYFSPKWRSSGLPNEFFCVTAGFQRSSYCVKTVEVRLAFCFNIIHFVDIQFREILVCFLGTKIMAFADIAKWNHFIFLQNDGLPGFLLNSFV